MKRQQIPRCLDNGARRQLLPWKIHVDNVKKKKHVDNVKKKKKLRSCSFANILLKNTLARYFPRHLAEEKLLSAQSFSAGKYFKYFSFACRSKWYNNPCYSQCMCVMFKRGRSDSSYALQYEEYKYQTKPEVSFLPLKTLKVR